MIIFDGALWCLAREPVGVLGAHAQVLIAACAPLWRSRRVDKFITSRAHNARAPARVCLSHLMNDCLVCVGSRSTSCSLARAALLESLRVRAGFYHPRPRERPEMIDGHPMLVSDYHLRSYCAPSTRTGTVRGGSTNKIALLRFTVRSSS